MQNTILTKNKNQVILQSKTLLMTFKFLFLSYSPMTSFNPLWQIMTTNLQISLRNKCHACKMGQPQEQMGLSIQVLVMLHVWCIKIQNFWGRGRVSLQFFWCVFFLRWDGSYATYCTLLSNILASLGVNIDWEKLSLAQMRKLSLSMQ